MMADLIDRVEHGYDHYASPLQYTLPHLGITVDSGVFHRNRFAIAQLLAPSERRGARP